MTISKEVVDAIEDYILAALKNPTSSGAKVELVPELVRALNEVSCRRRP